MYGLGSRGGTPGGRFGGAFPVHKAMKNLLKKCSNLANKSILIFTNLCSTIHTENTVYKHLHLPN